LLFLLRLLAGRRVCCLLLAAASQGKRCQRQHRSALGWGLGWLGAAAGLLR
jgi:hypothetical protein